MKATGRPRNDRIITFAWTSSIRQQQARIDSENRHPKEQQLASVQQKRVERPTKVPNENDVTTTGKEQVALLPHLVGFHDQFITVKISAVKNVLTAALIRTDSWRKNAFPPFIFLSLSHESQQWRLEIMVRSSWGNLKWQRYSYHRRSRPTIICSTGSFRLNSCHWISSPFG